MAIRNDFTTTPSNFSATNKVETKYLDLAGLSLFWEKAKKYVDDADSAQYEKITGEWSEATGALTDRVDALSVNGQTFKEAGDAIVLTAADIEYTAKDGETPAVSVKDGMDALAGEISAIQGILGEDASTVVNSVEFSTNHDYKTGEGEGETTVNGEAYVTVDADHTTGVVKVTVDDTKIDAAFKAVAEQMESLEAAAGVSSATVENAGENLLVELSIEGTGEGDAKKGAVKLTLDDTALVGHLSGMQDGIDANAEAIGKNAEAIGKNAEDIKANADAIAALQKDTVTSVTKDNSSVETYVEISVEKTEGTNDVVVTLDDSGLSTAISALGGLSINGKNPYAVDATSGAVTATAITLAAGDIKMADSTDLESKIGDLDDQIAALASATHFIGVTTNELTDGAVAGNITIDGATVTPVDGDIVIAVESNTKASCEFICSGGHWYLLGDTTAEQARLSAVETWIDANVISKSEIEALFSETPAEPAE
ncbi:MAG: hypothetical protein IKT40_01850 [Bacilli bacterium]|nr:hypothetical protein [Bacilli bacterium]